MNKIINKDKYIELRDGYLWNLKIMETKDQLSCLSSEVALKSTTLFQISSKKVNFKIKTIKMELPRYFFFFFSSATI